MSQLRPMLALALLCLLSTSPVAALDLTREEPVDRNDPEVVFAYQGDAVLTQTGIDAAFSRIPEEHRLLFIREGEQVDRLVRNIMKAEVLALDAIEKGFAEDPVVRERMILAAHKELAGAWMDQIRKNAPEADYEAMAYEDYLANPKDYQTPEYIDVTHILIGTEERSDEEALALAQDVRERALASPDTFTRLVMEYSDDPAKAQNEGTYLRVSRGQMAEPFENAAYALENAGNVSAPVKTNYGYHIIRLDQRYEPGKRPFEEVRDDAVAKMKQRHVNEFQETYIKGLLAEGIVLPEGSVQVMLKRYFGEDLENAPQY